MHRCIQHPLGITGDLFYLRMRSREVWNDRHTALAQQHPAIITLHYLLKCSSSCLPVRRRESSSVQVN
jgi:hypothetical protein